MKIPATAGNQLAHENPLPQDECPLEKEGDEDDIFDEDAKTDIRRPTLPDWQCGQVIKSESLLTSSSNFDWQSLHWYS